MSKKCSNWRMVFGNNPWTWFLPIRPTDIAVDPYNFPKRMEMVAQSYEMIIHSYSDKDNTI